MSAHQSCAWLLASCGGSGLASRDTWIQMASYRSFLLVWTVQGTMSGMPKRLGRFFWDDRKYSSVRIWGHKHNLCKLHQQQSDCGATWYLTVFIHSSVKVYSYTDMYWAKPHSALVALTIFLCMAIMYPMKGLSCTGVMCPLATPLGMGVSGLRGTTVLGPPLGIRTGLFARLWSPAEPLAIGVRSDESEDWGNTKNSLLEREPSWRERVDAKWMSWRTC